MLSLTLCVLCLFFCLFFFFFKQKTAYEMRISDWSSDVCSSDLLATFGIAIAFPFGLILAMGRRSKMPAIKTLCIMYIELIRGVPLISMLFMSSVMLPLFLPEGFSIDKLLRAQIAIIMFAAAYIVEVVRGGLQAIRSEEHTSELQSLMRISY